MLLNKIFFSFMFMLLNNIIIAQNFNFGKEELLYSPKQLKEDINYYFNKINEIHPDPYFYCPLDEYEKKKKEIYDQIDRPMTREEFMWIMAPMNSCMDSHSRINISAFNYYIYNWVWNIHHKQKKIFPPVHIEENKLFIDSDSEHKEIEEISGIPTTKIINFMKSLHNSKLYTKRNDYLIKSFFSPYLDLYFNIRSPYIIKYKGQENLYVLDGVNFEYYSRKTGFNMLETNESNYVIYPNSSIGILQVYNLNKAFSENLSKNIQNFQDSLSKYDIKYVFLDLSNNLGGTIRGFELLDIIPHDTIYEFRSIIEKKKMEIKNIISKKTSALLIQKQKIQKETYSFYKE